MVGGEMYEVGKEVVLRWKEREEFVGVKLKDVKLWVEGRYGLGVKVSGGRVGVIDSECE